VRDEDSSEQPTEAPGAGEDRSDGERNMKRDERTTRLVPNRQQTVVSYPAGISCPGTQTRKRGPHENRP
jgi:hypothetical protein